MTMDNPEIRINGQEQEPSFAGDHWILPSDPEIVDKAETEFAKRIEEQGWIEHDSDENFKLALGFKEALVNAIVHGNLKLQNAPGAKNVILAAQRMIQENRALRKIPVAIDIDITPREIRIKIKDQGFGFDWKKQNSAGLESFGRGRLIMQKVYDEVIYNESGNEITLIKRKKKEML